jgi:hypothetical protein
MSETTKFESIFRPILMIVIIVKVISIADKIFNGYSKYSLYDIRILYIDIILFCTILLAIRQTYLKVYLIVFLVASVLSDMASYVVGHNYNLMIAMNILSTLVLVITFYCLLKHKTQQRYEPEN